MIAIMSSRWRFVILPAILLSQLPILIRFWPNLAAAAPAWGLMFAQTLALLATGIVLAAFAAFAVAYCRRRWGANG